MSNTTTLLQYEAEAPEVYEALAALKRTGWVNAGVQNPESVKDHTIALIALAGEVAPELTDPEKNGLFAMLEVHDWPEALCGDEVILELEPNESKARKDAKLEREREAMERICAELPNGAEILKLWVRFETADDPAAVFARELDKYQAVEQALVYEEEQGISLFGEFLTYSINFIHHPVLLRRIDALRERWQSAKM